ncbi:glutathione S-transferase [Marinicella pacifica]|uniref:Glutathione S-transferase n=1 Tax=Marinicella pacifica TaxID=1171543 RepID=A0A917CWN3_9GAMM|nr:glutathione S-transferase [Marinicella pacifica]GGF99196.1 glutathione S-transferase [Marinicella pacifica]
MMSNQELPVLYSFRRCPYAMRARMAIAVSEFYCELRELILKDKPTAMLKASPKGTVPVLVLQDGQVIDESLDIMRYVLQYNDPENWLADKAHSLALIEEYDRQFKPLLDRYKYHVGYPELSFEKHRANTLPFLNTLNQRLEQSANLISDDTRLADIAIMPFIRQYAFVDKNWFDGQDWPHLQHWLNHHLNSRLFHQVMLKFKLFNAGSTYQFPAEVK